MYRKELVDLLQNNPMGLHELAQLLGMPIKTLEDDLQHLIKSLKHSEYELVISPAVCRKCGFHFDKHKMHKPGKCPQCHGTWIQEPLLEVKTK